MFKAFEDYIEEYRGVREQELLEARQARIDWLTTARTMDKPVRLTSLVPQEYKSSFNCYCMWDVSDKAYFVDAEKYVAVIDVYVLDGKEYKVVQAVNTKDSKSCDRWRMKDRVVEELDEHKKFLMDRHISKSDYAQTEGRSEEWCKERAVKDAAAHRKSIEQKVQKLIGEVVDILEDYDGWYLNGSNGKRCHMWFIHAGGYNIQRLHIRCLVKEVRV